MFLNSISQGIFYALLYLSSLSVSMPTNSSKPTWSTDERSSLLRERAKSNRREMIKSQVSEILNVQEGRSSLDEEENLWKNLRKNLMTTNSELPNPTVSALYSDYIEKLQSNFPSCQLPNKVTRYISNGLPVTGAFLYFDTIPSHAIKNFHFDIIAGQLHLYKTTPENKLSQGTLNEKIRITVSWIKRKGRDYETFMLDSKMVDLSSELWLHFDILLAVRYWHRRPRKNYGLLIEVENMEKIKLMANEFIFPMNCSDTFSTALPSILNDDRKSSFYPRLDISRIEIPNDDLTTTPPPSTNSIEFPFLSRHPSSSLQPLPTNEESSVQVLETLVDVNHMRENEEIMSSFTPSQSSSIFQPIIQRIITDRDDFLTVLQSLVKEQRHEFDLENNILDNIHLENTIIQKLSSGGNLATHSL